MVFYKYAGKSGFKILENLRLKITPPNEFNDPFEITPRSKFTRKLEKMQEEAKTNPEQHRSTYEQMKQAGRYPGSFEEFKAEFPEALQKHFPEYRRQAKLRLANGDSIFLDEVSKKMGILCLSKLPESIPMWSYYADQHRGIVFGVDVEKIGGYIRVRSGPVKYKKQRVRVDPYLPQKSPERQTQAIRVLFTKNREWKHEKEFRQVYRLSDLTSLKQANGKAKHYFWDLSGDAIKEIIFGCRASDRLKARICKEIQRRKRTFGHIRLLQCVRHKSKFELKIIPFICQELC